MYEYDRSGRVPLYRQAKEDREMSTIEETNTGHREAREEAAIDASYARWDALGLDGHDGRTVARFEAQAVLETPIRPDEATVTYAALALVAPEGGLRWWVTGRRAPNGAPTDDLIAWLIEHQVDPESWEVLW
jgi:hypothetical protein